MGSDETVLMLGENISVEEALRWGLVERLSSRRRWTTL